ncbi:hypothetical protein FOB63_004721 [Clavispora lusitaniae]|uniref:Glutamyl-tRNA(Gln) amidotransferase subunit F, mitochondrial n=2 Tax=Clavispora lusitaniae TaxID=36911 RepID=GATF_CLAL4|nr:uncharacterized protein CLUG_03118 [Clavispora lusitaniae ATCC 42720]C4Y3K5.1 RecName: Full=Glutamyl-tRNA(Gln) amidotransferase subunit F, mitochondrial; Short=Glu-AdT subunit F [Clavispora lusitaniae ATCC 42720]EEQ38992.1 hypothetical protein CLUG_03118 [Clavispora lusitaniae ATCC 42720]KAF7579651.1 hypothetical protein FOB63_004721 [Clavispora lusitaniae]OVF07606.1 putative glutamyl-tRNA(Gln) amidotransferase subunit [Clavispora lusitaniae]
MFLRQFSTSPALLKGKVLPELKNAQEISQFLRKSTWNVHDLIPSKEHITNEVDSRVVRKMLRLSGLDENLPEPELNRWAEMLNTHVAFINHVSDLHSSTKGEIGSSVFRLLASDHKPESPLTLKELLRQVDEISDHVSDQRGERGFDTSELRTRINRAKSTAEKE